MIYNFCVRRKTLLTRSFDRDSVYCHFEYLTFSFLFCKNCKFVFLFQWMFPHYSLTEVWKYFIVKYDLLLLYCVRTISFCFLYSVSKIQVGLTGTPSFRRLFVNICTFLSPHNKSTREGLVRCSPLGVFWSFWPFYNCIPVHETSDFFESCYWVVVTHGYRGSNIRDLC